MGTRGSCIPVGLEPQRPGQSPRAPQWKRYFLAGLRLMYVAFISSASGLRTSLNRSPLVLTTWLSMYRISFLGACTAIPTVSGRSQEPASPYHPFPAHLLGSHGPVNLLILCAVYHHVPAKDNWMSACRPRKACQGLA